MGGRCGFQITTSCPVDSAGDGAVTVFFGVKQPSNEPQFPRYKLAIIIAVFGFGVLTVPSSVDVGLRGHVGRGPLNLNRATNPTAMGSCTSTIHHTTISKRPLDGTPHLTPQTHIHFCYVAAGITIQ